MKGTWLFALLISVAATIHSHAQWCIQASGTTRHLNGIALSDSSTWIAVGDSGTILKSTTAGITWYRVPGGTIQNLRAVAFSSFDRSDGYAVGDSVVCHTTDAGETWHDTLIAGNFISVANGAAYLPVTLIGARDGRVIYSENSGGHWAEQSFHGPVISIAVGYGALQSYYAYVATGTYLYHLASGSALWDSISVGSNLFDVLISGNLYHQVQYLVGGGGDFAVTPVLYRRSLPDTAWTIVRFPDVGDYLTGAATVENTLIAYACGTGGKIFKSIDAGKSWLTQATGISSALRSIACFDSAHGIAVGDSGAILTTINGGTTGTTESSRPPARYSLGQNYPNPFNPSTAIQYTLPRQSRVKLQAFDLLGQLVATLVDGIEETGEHRVAWRSSVASGLYLYRLEATDVSNPTVLFTSVRKMLLVR